MRIISVILAAAFVSAGGVSAQDTTVIKSSGAPAWGNVKVVEELRIGTVEGDEKYIFGSIDAVAVTKSGSVFVLDGQGPRLRMYDARGRFVREVGKKGEGPGEYRFIVAMGMTPSDELATYDVGQQRISLYSNKGDFVRSFPSRVPGNWGGSAFRVDRKGNLIVYASVAKPGTTRTMPNGQVVEQEGAGMRDVFYLRLNPRGAILDSLRIPESRAARQPSFVLMTPEGYLQPFINEQIVALSPLGYVVTGYTNRYRIELRNGSRVTAIDRDWTPLKLSAKERAQWEAKAEFIGRKGGASAGVKIPAVKPAFRDIEVDEDGRIWVNRYAATKEYPVAPDRPASAGPPVSIRDVPTFDVLDVSGRLIATVVIPPRTQILLRSGHEMWGVVRGEFDENYLVRFRIQAVPG